MEGVDDWFGDDVPESLDSYLRQEEDALAQSDLGQDNQQTDYLATLFDDFDFGCHDWENVNFNMLLDDVFNSLPWAPPTYLDVFLNTPQPSLPISPPIPLLSPMTVNEELLCDQLISILDDYERLPSPLPSPPFNHCTVNFDDILLPPPTPFADASDVRPCVVQQSDEPTTWMAKTKQVCAFIT